MSAPLPTVGRVVHYYLPADLTRANREPPVVYAALVTGVRDDLVVLAVFMNRSTPKGRALTEYVDNVPYSETPAAYCWSWPPRVP